MKKFLSSLFRNRRGAACVACFCLVFGVVSMFGVWGWLCVTKGIMFDLPTHVVEAIGALIALKGWTTRDDRIAARESTPPVDTPPGA